MNKYILGVLFFSFCSACYPPRQYYICGMVSGMRIEPHFDLSNFENFTSKIAGKLADTLYLDSNRIYAPNHSFYFMVKRYPITQKQSILYAASGKRLLVLDEIIDAYSLIWLNDLVIINQYSKYYNRKIAISLKTGRKKIYRSKNSFYFIGQDATKAYFSSSEFNNWIQARHIKEYGTIISISHSGIKRELINNSLLERTFEKNFYSYKWGWNYYLRDTFFDYHYYNSFFDIRSICINNYSQDIITFNTTCSWNNKAQQEITGICNSKSVNQSYAYNDTAYLLLNDSLLYRFTKFSVEKTINLHKFHVPGRIMEFKVEGDNFIFKINDYYFSEFSISNDSIITTNGLKAAKFAYANNSLGILNMKNGAIQFPKIIYRSSSGKP